MDLETGIWLGVGLAVLLFWAWWSDRQTDRLCKSLLHSYPVANPKTPPAAKQESTEPKVAPWVHDSRHNELVQHQCADLSCCRTSYDTQDPTFVCDICDRRVGWCCGSSDDEICDECWASRPAELRVDSNAD